jgi:hypothetical protein
MYFGYKLSPTESRYSILIVNFLLPSKAVKHFRFFLEGCSLTLFPDHNPLVANSARV